MEHILVPICPPPHLQRGKNPCQRGGANKLNTLNTAHVYPFATTFIKRNESDP